MSIKSIIGSIQEAAGPENLKHGLHPAVLLWTRIVGIVLPLVFLLAVLMQPWANPIWMFLDPLTAAEQSGDCCHTYYGFVSYLGVMLWTGTAAVCLFCALLLAIEKSHTKLMWFSLAAGTLAAMLALDDAFMLHELVLPSLGVPQVLVLAIYALLAVAYLLLGWRVVLGADFWLLIVGGSGLVVSLLIDTLTHGTTEVRIYFEDGAKFLGIFCWSTFHVSTMLDKVLAVRNPN